MLVWLSACALDRSHQVYVAPSAYEQLPAIRDAVSYLNAMVGPAPGGEWVIHEADDGERRDDEIVVRTDPSLSLLTPRCAYSRLTRRHGIVIHLMPGADARTIAHELGHSAGLEHDPDEGNLMWFGQGGWDLTVGQIEALK
jgi:hypothetical protein